MKNYYKLVSRSAKTAKKKDYRAKAKVWLYSGAASWHFVTLSKKLSREIKREFGGISRGWGSIPVTAAVGQTSWETSIFPDSKTGAYLLPLKAAVRKKENIKAGQTIELGLNI